MHHERGRRRPTSGRRPKKGDFQSPLNSYAGRMSDSWLFTSLLREAAGPSWAWTRARTGSERSRRNGGTEAALGWALGHGLLGEINNKRQRSSSPSFFRLRPLLIRRWLWDRQRALLPRGPYYTPPGSSVNSRGDATSLAGGKPPGLGFWRQSKLMLECEIVRPQHCQDGYNGPLKGSKCYAHYGSTN